MGRMEVITRTERRRTYSEAEKAAVLAEASAPGVTSARCRCGSALPRASYTIDGRGSGKR